MENKEFETIKELEAERDMCNRRGTLDRLQALKDVLKLIDEIERDEWANGDGSWKLVFEDSRIKVIGGYKE